MSGRVSVVIPTYGEEPEVLERSIRSALRQTISNIEVIVVDDNSDTPVDSVLKSIIDERLSLIQHEINRGGSAARNTGANNSNGEYIAFLDADDEWLPSKLERQIDYLEKKPRKYTACLCAKKSVRRGITKGFRKYISHHNIFDTKDTESVPLEGGQILIPYLLKGEYPTGGSSTILIYRATFDAIGGFDESFNRHQDWEFIIRAAKQTNIAHVENELVLKHASDPPDADTLKKSKIKLLNTFGDDIINAELSPWELYRIHRNDLGMMYIANGELILGLDYLDIRNLELKDSARIVFKYFSSFVNY